ncbi:CsbD family protein [Nocardia sp. NPDC050712]|uniref:CsbD family protein n=1 Tax=Nocardia sp. NPDC050712 TaxID=3155518 RepID=UPI0033D13DBF
MSLGDKIDEATGKAKENVGRAAGNDRMESEGKVEQAEAKVKEGFEDVKNSISGLAEKAKNALHSDKKS